MAHPAGYFCVPPAGGAAPGYAAAAARWPALPARLVSAGGVTVTAGQAAAALGLLAASGGVMVRQVLAAAGNPLAGCDYHAAGGPYRRSVLLPPGGRGAAGRPAAKAAFMAALAAVLEQAAAAEPARHFAADLAGARAAFVTDSGYAAAMAKAAVAVMEREHAASRRAALSQAVHRALSACDARRGEFACTAAAACGTGDCRFAAGPLAAAVVPAGPGRVPRPVNHARAGTGFGTAAAAAALEAAVPFAVAVRVCSADGSIAGDAVAVLP